MQSIKIKELTVDGFEKYGAFVNLMDPLRPKLGESPIEFFRDVLPFNLGQQTAPSISVCKICERPLIIDASEYHSYTAEINLPLDGDMLMHVAPATDGKQFPVAEVEVFRVPKGTAVMIYPGVWHHAAFVHDTKIVNVLVVLPQRTYANDCFCCHIPKNDWICIEID